MIYSSLKDGKTQYTWMLCVSEVDKKSSQETEEAEQGHMIATVG